MVKFETDNWIRTNWTEESTIEFDSTTLMLRFVTYVEFAEIE